MSDVIFESLRAKDLVAGQALSELFAGNSFDQFVVVSPDIRRESAIDFQLRDDLRIHDARIAYVRTYNGVKDETSTACAEDPDSRYTRELDGLYAKAYDKAFHYPDDRHGVEGVLLAPAHVLRPDDLIADVVYRATINRRRLLGAYIVAEAASSRVVHRIIYASALFYSVAEARIRAANLPILTTGQLIADGSKKALQELMPIPGAGQRQGTTKTSSRLLDISPVTGKPIQSGSNSRLRRGHNRGRPRR